MRQAFPREKKYSLQVAGLAMANSVKADRALTLTDDYWIHQGSLNDIYHSIKVGYPDKGMQSWEKFLSGRSVTSGYIKTLRGTNPPNGKSAAGRLVHGIFSASRFHPQHRLRPRLLLIQRQSQKGK